MPQSSILYNLRAHFMGQINKLTDTFVRKCRQTEKIQRFNDGDKLWLVVSPGGSKVWRLLWKNESTQKQFTIGSYPAVSLKQAREVRDRVNTQLAQGIDPSKENDEEENSTVQVVTFRDVAQEWFEKKTSAQVASSRKLKWQRISKYLLPVLGHRLMSELKIMDFVTILRRIEETGHAEMARRVAQIATQICKFAYLLEYTSQPVAFGLSSALQEKVTPCHRAAILDEAKIGVLLRDIDRYNGYVSTIYALRIMPYVFVRSQELRMATWSEIDFEKSLWTIPAEHMKMKRPHVVPLASQVVRLFHELRNATGGSDLVFPSPQSNTRNITDVCLLNGLRRLGYGRDEMCIHGFRSIASTLLNEKGYRPDVIEAQLAHCDKNEVRAAYNRALYLSERRTMMQDWADYLDTLRSTVTA